MPVSAGAAMLLLAPLMASASAESPERGAGIDTIFGQVRVGADAKRAAAEAGEAAHTAARTVLGLRNQRFSIVEAEYTSGKWGELSGDGAPIYVWQFNRSAASRSPPPPASILSHEIGHDLFIRHLVPSTRGGQYGGDAPDWLDEMAAVAFEGDGLRAARRRAAVRYAGEGKLIPLRRFLTMTHPEMESGSIPESADGTVIAFEPASNETPRFYAMAYAFYEYLVGRTGNPAIVAELAAAFRTGEPLEQWLLTRTGQGGGIGALNADFEAWIASDPRYGGYGHRG
jgi:hypothetical protein